MNAHFQEYPKVLSHPAEAPAVVSQWNEQMQRHVPEHGMPAKFQPVTVHNRDQEEEYLAKGYQASGRSDPNAYEKARASVEPTDYSFQEYPKWVGDKIVNSREEEDMLIGNVADASSAKKSVKERTRVAPADPVAVAA
ncbi:MAG: hypothetical protein KGP14_01815 [Betaproteobacteria bacterium]|nr:hypothetical protein [Betaproteobacteria bacterium]